MHGHGDDVDLECPVMSPDLESLASDKAQLVAERLRDDDSSR
jgi:hypothetical protein